MTIFEKCGVSNEMVKDIKLKGFFVPERHERLPKTLRSIGFPEIVYQWADSFTPPLTQEEKEYYIENPKGFYEDAVMKAKLFKEIAGLLLKALKNISYLTPVEAMAACLAILRIYYASFDYNFYKYDRHLEFHDYEESPVGYYYLNLKKLCKLAAIRSTVPASEEWAQQKFLSILNLPEKLSLSLRYEMDCAGAFQKLVDLPEFEEFSAFSRDLFGLLAKKYPELAREIKETGEKYYKYPEDFLEECMRRGGKKPDTVSSVKERTKGDYLDVKKYLKSKERRELESCVSAIGWFTEVQEELHLIIDSKIGDNAVRDAEFKTFELVKKIISENPGLMKKEYQSEIEKLFECKGLEGYVAPRIFVYDAEKKHYFPAEVEALFFEEIERWFRSNA
jgi:hypothetical protein